MGTTAQKLQYLVNAKASIDTALTAKGVTPPAAFGDYGNAIASIPSGGSNKLAQVADTTVTKITAEDLEGATKIGPHFLRYCNNLKSVVIPNSVEEILLYACANCNALREVEIGTGITLIDNAVFENSRSLTKLTIHATTPPRLLSAGMFTIYINIYVPAESVEAYKAATNWSALASYIQAIPE